MKKLSVLALVLAIVAAFATHVKSKPALAKAFGNTTVNPIQCVEGDIVDTGVTCLTTNTQAQCQVTVVNSDASTSNVNAFQNVGCSEALKRSM